MNKFFKIVAIISIGMLAACGDPRDTVIPADLSNMGAVTVALEKLSPEEKGLVTEYIVGHMMSSALGVTSNPGIPDGMTIRNAIAEQRQANADRAAKLLKQQELKAKLQAERSAAMESMTNAVTVTLVSKKIVERGYDEKIAVVFGYKNNTSKDISGVKGTIVVKDLFGDDISSFQVSNDDAIKANESSTWNGERSITFSFSNRDRKLVELSDDKYTVTWEPHIIVFADGTQMKLPN